MRRKTIRNSFSVLWPVLAALYSPVGLYAENMSEIVREDVYRALIVAAALAVVVTILCWLIFRDRTMALLVAAGSMLFFFSYGHIYAALKTVSVGSVVLGRHRYLFPVMTLLFLGWVYWIWKRDAVRQTWFQFLRVMLVILLAFPVYSILSRWDSAMEAPEIEENLGRTDILNDSEEFPDIYYIVLDAYTRADVLEEYFGFDNSDFIEALQSRGFFVAEEARSNYTSTFLSIPASLNLTYMNDLADEYTLDDEEWWPELMERLRHSEVRNILEDEGYAILSYDSGHPFTWIYDADEFIRPPENTSTFNTYEAMLLDTTLARFFIDGFGNASARDEQFLYPEYEAHRSRIRFTLSTLGDIAVRPERTFVFAHIMCPHPPFVFEPDGEPIIGTEPFHLGLIRSDESVAADYTGQIEYLNSLVLEAVDEILRNSTHTPYILIQADHGMKSHLDWMDTSMESQFQRFSILSAYYFPNEAYDALYPSITPVNSFRVVFNQLLGSSYPMLEESQYYTRPDDMLLFEEVQFPDTDQ